MKKRIFVEEKAKAKLREIFGCSNVQVWKALTYESNSQMARKIRYVALTQLGGTPNWDIMRQLETTHNEVDKTMEQTIGEHVKIVASKRTGDVMVYADGKVQEHHVNVDIPTFMQIQQSAGLLAMSY